MDIKLLKAAGVVAGIGGMGMLVLYLIFKDIIAADFLPTLSPQQAFIVIAAIVAVTFFAAVIALFVWFIGQNNRYIRVRARFFITLVSIILVFSLGSAYLISHQLDKPPIDENMTMLDKGIELFHQGKYDEAELNLNAIAPQMPESALPWYWRSKVALAKNSLETALSLVDTALRLNARHVESVLLKTKILLLSGGDSRSKSKTFASKHASSFSQLKKWHKCVENHGFYVAILTTNMELEKYCPTN